MSEDPVDAYGKPLFEAFPEWRSLARQEMNCHGEEMVVIDVSPPAAADVDEGLWITWGDGEITVGFGEYHQHFDAWTGEDGWLGADCALEFVKRIVSEQIAVATLFNDDEAICYTMVETGESKRPVVSDRPFNRMLVRSWHGTFDADP